MKNPCPLVYCSLCPHCIALTTFCIICFQKFITRKDISGIVIDNLYCIIKLKQSIYLSFNVMLSFKLILSLMLIFKKCTDVLGQECCFFFFFPINNLLQMKIHRQSLFLTFTFAFFLRMWKKNLPFWSYSGMIYLLLVVHQDT